MVNIVTNLKKIVDYMLNKNQKNIASNQYQVYEPKLRDNPKCFMGKPSAWGDIPTIIKDIITRFDLKTEKALEFCVEFGFSTSCLANYFDSVIGVDTFEGDAHTTHKGDHFDMTKNNMKPWTNIKLVKSRFEDYIVDNEEMFDLCHIDIVHDYQPTFDAGEWAIQHCPVTIFHDTHSFPSSVGVAVKDLAEKHNLEHYDYPNSHGLGILVNKKILQK